MRGLKILVAHAGAKSQVTGFMQDPQSFAFGVRNGFPQFLQGAPYIDKT
jgi:hypothetical protein